MKLKEYLKRIKVNEKDIVVTFSIYKRESDEELEDDYIVRSCYSKIEDITEEDLESEVEKMTVSTSVIDDDTLFIDYDFDLVIKSLFKKKNKKIFKNLLTRKKK